MSPEFQDLVSRLLDRSPSSRLTWAELCTHPFWGASPLEQLSVPAAISAPRSPQVRCGHLELCFLREQGWGYGGTPSDMMW